MRISDWSSDVCSSDLHLRSDDRNAVRDRREAVVRQLDDEFAGLRGLRNGGVERLLAVFGVELEEVGRGLDGGIALQRGGRVLEAQGLYRRQDRSEEHTSALQSLMRISYSVFCLKQKKT